MNRIFTEDEVLRIGLLYAGFNAHRQHRVERATCERHFKSQYSSSPLVCAKIWEDLITSPDIWENQTHPKAASFEKFLMALNFLKTYQTEEKMAGMWKTCETSARNWAWYFVKKIQALKSKKGSFLASCREVVFVINSHVVCWSSHVGSYGLRHGLHRIRTFFTRLMGFTVEQTKSSIRPLQKIQNCTRTSSTKPDLIMN